MIRIGTVGTSSIVAKFVDAAKKTNGAEINVVSSRNQQNGMNFAQANIPDAQVIDDWKKFVGLVDAVYIGSPNGTHFAIAKFLLENNIHVLVEKTATFKAVELDQLLKIACANNLIVLEAFRPVHYPQYEFLKDFVNEYNITTANFQLASYSRFMDDVLVGKIPAGFQPDLGRGTTYDMLIYPLELAIDLFGDVKHVKSMRRNLNNGVAVINTVLLEHNNGILTTINNSKMSYGSIGNEIASVDKVNLTFDCVANMQKIDSHKWISKSEIQSHNLFTSDGKINDMIYELNTFIQMIEMQEFIVRDKWAQLTRKAICVLEAIDSNQDF